MPEQTYNPDLTSALKDAARRLPSSVTVGVAVLDSTCRLTAAIHPDRMFNPSTLFSLAIEHARHLAVEQGDPDARGDQLIQLRPEDDVRGPSILRPLAPGRSITLDTAATIMLRWGDVIGRSVVIRQLQGSRRINDLLHNDSPLAPQSTHLRETPEYLTGTTTPLETAKLLTAVTANDQSRWALQTNPHIQGLRRRLSGAAGLEQYKANYLMQTLIWNNPATGNTFGRLLGLGSDPDPYPGLLSFDGNRGFLHEAVQIPAKNGGTFSVTAMTTGWPSRKDRLLPPLQHPGYDLLARIGEVVYDVA